MPPMASLVACARYSLGILLALAWHPLGVFLNHASIPVAIATGPQRGNRSGIARKMLLKPGAGKYRQQSADRCIQGYSKNP